MLLGPLLALVALAQSRARAQKPENDLSTDGDGPQVVECTIRGGRAFRITVFPEWAPRGAARFLELVDDAYFDGCALFRAQRNITVQFGIPVDKKLQKKWLSEAGPIADDPARPDVAAQHAWRAGLISFAGGGPNSRSAQVFVTLRGRIPQLGGEMWETPFGRVDAAGVRVLNRDVYYGYGDRDGPDQGRLYADDAYAVYLPQKFPLLTYLETCARVAPPAAERFWVDADETFSARHVFIFLSVFGSVVVIGVFLKGRGSPQTRRKFQFVRKKPQHAV